MPKKLDSRQKAGKEYFAIRSNKAQDLRRESRDIGRVVGRDNGRDADKIEQVAFLAG